MKLHLFFLLLISIILPVLSLASTGGIPGYHLYETGSASCNACHTPPSSSPVNSLSISGNNTVANGSTNSYTLTLIAPKTQPVLAGGFNLAATNGVLLSTGADTSIINSELVHSSAKTVTDIGTAYQVSWGFDWTAPTQAGTTTVTACGLPVNADGLAVDVCTRHCGGGGPRSVTSDGLTACTVFSIQVDQPPTAIVGNDQTVSELTLVTLDGSASTDDVSISSYQWSQLSGTAVSLTNANASIASFTAQDVITPGTTEQLVFRLTVTDNTGLSHSADLSIFVKDAAVINTPPVAVAGGDQIVNENTPVTLDASASSDPEDGAVTSYLWEQIAGNNTISLSSNSIASPVFTSPVVNVGGDLLSFKLTVADSLGLQATDTVNITVNNTDAPPVAKITDYSGTVITAIANNAAVTLYGSYSSDPDGAITAYSWVQTTGTPINPVSGAQGQFSFTTPDSLGETLQVMLTVTGDDGVTQGSVLASLILDNLPPVVDAGVAQTVVEGSTVYLTATISDPNNDVQSILWQQINCAPDCISLAVDNLAQVSFVAPQITTTGVMQFQVTVTDTASSVSSATTSVTLTDNGISLYPPDAIPFYSYSNQPMAISIAVDDALSSSNITNLQPLSSGFVTDTQNMPASLPYDLLGIAISTDTPASSVVLTLHFPEPIPEGVDFYQYISGQGWVNNSEPRDFNNLVYDTASASWVETSEQVTFSADRTRVYIHITDGGPSDDDGLVNGVIRYLGGVGVNVEEPVIQNGTAGGALGPLFILVLFVWLARVRSKAFKS